MKLGVLQTGESLPQVVATFGDMPDTFIRWLSPHLPDWRFATYNLISGDFPSGPDDCDAWLITGSRFGVYDSESWIGPLKEFIRVCAAGGHPVIGICFGHQIIAEALGGRAELSSRGWGVGIDHYRLETPEGPQDWPMLVSHQDQVVDKPPSARLLGGSDHCPIGVLEYEAPILSVQFHPEFVSGIVSILVRNRAGLGLSEDHALRALDSLQTPPANEAAGRWAANWLRTRLAA